MTMSTPDSAADGLRRLMAEAIGTQEVLAASLGLNPTDLRCLEAFSLWPRRDIKPGSRVDLTLMFEALQNRPPEHALIVRLRDRSGELQFFPKRDVLDQQLSPSRRPRGGEPCGIRSQQLGMRIALLAGPVGGA